MELTSLFNELNRDWFDGKLRRRTVRSAKLRIPGARTLGLYNAKRKVIYLRAGLSEPQLTETLLHEMCHIGCPSHGPRFVAKMERLRAAGAPISDTYLTEFNPFRRAADMIDDLAAEFEEGMFWSKARVIVARGLSMSVRDLDQKIPWARKRWKRIQRENSADHARASALFKKVSAE